MKKVKLALLRRAASWLELISVVAAGAGIFQGRPVSGFCVAVITIGGSMIVTTIIAKEE